MTETFTITAEGDLQRENPNAGPLVLHLPTEILPSITQIKVSKEPSIIIMFQNQ